MKTDWMIISVGKLHATAACKAIEKGVGKSLDLGKRTSLAGADAVHCWDAALLAVMAAQAYDETFEGADQIIIELKNHRLRNELPSADDMHSPTAIHSFIQPAATAWLLLQMHDMGIPAAQQSAGRFPDAAKRHAAMLALTLKSGGAAAYATCLRALRAKDELVPACNFALSPSSRAMDMNVELCFGRWSASKLAEGEWQVGRAMLLADMLEPAWRGFFASAVLLAGIDDQAFEDSDLTQEQAMQRAAGDWQAAGS